MLGDAELSDLISKNTNRKELFEKLSNPIISIENTATLLGVVKTTVRRWTNKGKLKCIRTPGGQRRFYLQDILEFINNGG